MKFLKLSVLLYSVRISDIAPYFLHNLSCLGTLNSHQMKLQEAKFEMITSEASYLNSLNVLVDHFRPSLENCDFITWEEKMILFGKIEPGISIRSK